MAAAQHFKFNVCSQNFLLKKWCNMFLWNRVTIFRYQEKIPNLVRYFLFYQCITSWLTKPCSYSLILHLNTQFEVVTKQFASAVTTTHCCDLKVQLCTVTHNKHPYNGPLLSFCTVCCTMVLLHNYVMNWSSYIQQHSKPQDTSLSCLKCWPLHYVPSVPYNWSHS